MFSPIIKPSRSCILATPEGWWNSFAQLSLPPEPVFHNTMCGSQFCPNRTTPTDACCCSFCTQNFWRISTWFAAWRYRPALHTLSMLQSHMDFPNPGIWAAFLYVHHCLFQHTCGIYPPDLLNTWLANSSNKKLGQKEDKIVLHFVEEVYYRVQNHVFHDAEWTPLFIYCLHQAVDTWLVGWQVWAEMFLLAIAKLENPPNHWLAIHHTVDPRCCCDPLYIKNLKKDILAAMDQYFMCQNHHVKFLPPWGLSVELDQPWSIQDPQGMDSLSVSNRVVLATVPGYPAAVLVWNRTGWSSPGC